MARSRGNSHSDNYTGFKLFATLHPQSNFRINLRFDRELVEVWQTWNGVLGLHGACYNSGGRPCAPGEPGRCPRLQLREENQSINQCRHT